MGRMMTPKRANKVGVTAFLLFLFAFALRLFFAFETVVDTPVRNDAANYVIYAGNLINHQIFSKQQGENPQPDSYWAPGYPVFLAINRLIADSGGALDYSVILVSQAVLSSAVVALTFLLGGMFLRYGLALSAATFSLFSPHLISYTGILLTETLFSFLLIAAIYCFCLFCRNKSNAVGVISGSLFGMAYLTNPVSLLLPVFLALIAVPITRQFSARKILPYIVIFLAITFSWHVRNAIYVSDTALSGSNRLYTNLVVGAHPNYHEIWHANPRDPKNPATLDMAKFQGSYWTFAETMKERFANRPGHYLRWYFYDKPIALWHWDVAIGFGDIFVYPVVTSPYHSNKLALASHVIMKSLHYWLFLFSLLGIVFAIYNWRTTNITALTLVTTTVYISSIYVLTQADGRYSVPLRPEMYLLAMFFLQSVHTGVSHLRNQTGKVQ